MMDKQDELNAALAQNLELFASVKAGIAAHKKSLWQNDVIVICGIYTGILLASIVAGLMLKCFFAALNWMF